MEAPKCKFCGHRHWLRDGHVGIKPNTVSDAPKRAMKATVKPETPSKAKFDRNVYQRDLMRKRRADRKKKRHDPKG